LWLTRNMAWSCVFLVPENVVQNLFKLWSEPHYIEWPPITSNNAFPCIREVWPGITCDVLSFEDPYNNDQMSVYVTIVIL